MIRKTLQKFFLIREGELGISLLMQLYIFLIITVLLIVKPTINALFLSELGSENLPLAYMLTAIVATLGFYFYNRALKSFPLRTVITATLLFFSFCFLGLVLLVHFALMNPFFLFVYYISVSLFAVLAASQFWILANMVYNAREAKRLFGFIGAGAISGGIFGGYLTSILASNFGNKTAIITATLMLLACIPILNLVWVKRVNKLSIYTKKQRLLSEKEVSVPAFKLIVRSKHLANLAGIVAVGVIMAKLVDFQFSDFAHKEMTNSDNLASFFGFWFSTFNVIALLIQLVLTNKIMDRLGVATSLLLLPLAIALGCLLFLTFPELWVLIILKGIDGSFKQSVYKAALELSIMPIPFQIKNQTKSYIDVVVDSIASGIAGLLLFFVTKKWQVSSVYVTVIILFFLFVWIVLIYRLREAYFDSFRKNLKTSLLRTNTKYRGTRTATTLQQAKNILKNGSEEEILRLLKKLKEFNLGSVKEDIVKLLDHPSHTVKIRAIGQLCYFDKGTARAKVEEMLHLGNGKLAIAAMEYILDNTHIHNKELFDAYLDHSDSFIANAALICLSREARHNSKLKEKYNLNQRISKSIRKSKTEPLSTNKDQLISLLLAIGYAGSQQFYGFLEENLDHMDDTIKRSAMNASGLTKDHRFIKKLLEFLETKVYRNCAIKALNLYGNELSNTLYSLEFKEMIGDGIKPFIPKVIGSFSNQNSINILFRLLKNKDVRTRLSAARRLRKLRQSNTDLYFSKRRVNQNILAESNYYQYTLKALDSMNYIREHEELMEEVAQAYGNMSALLEQQLDLSLQSIFELLSVQYPFADMEVAYFGLKSKEQHIAGNALEFLDNLLHSKLRSAVLPMLEHTISGNPDSSKIAKSTTMDECHCVRTLVKNRGKRIKIAGLKIMSLSRNRKYVSVARRLTRHDNPEIREAALAALQQLEENLRLSA